MSGPKIGRRSRAQMAVAVGDALKRLTVSLGIAPKLRELRVLELWSEVVGEQIARVTEAERVEQGTLYVAVRSAPWRAELTMCRLELIERLNAAVGATVITEIRFR